MARIGKYVIDSLTRSMYEDSRCIYREYIQNAADQIDIAREQHIEENDYYEIHVRIFRSKRRTHWKRWPPHRNHAVSVRAFVA